MRVIVENLNCQFARADGAATTAPTVNATAAVKILFTEDLLTKFG